MEENYKKTVFFGPFVGEFGWELLFWHGWVKRLCRTRYKDCYKIACSFPGRYPFYPEVDAFWPLPDEFLKFPISSRNYITDYWNKGKPEATVPANLPDVWPRLKRVIADFQKKLPKDTEFIHPWTYRYDKEDKRHYGVDKKYTPYAPPYSKQILVKIQPTQKGRETLKKIVSPEEKLIVIFPRKRNFRRPDKNWKKESYQLLINRIQKKLPGYKIAILGEPGGAFFEEGVPKNCLDLINVNPYQRMDIHLAAVSQAKLAVGGQSGGVSFAMAGGAKTITWGNAVFERVIAKENYLNSPLIFLPLSDPSIDLIFKYINWFIGINSMPLDNLLRISKIIFYRIFNPRYPHLFRLRLKQIFKI
ncbi:MAG: hypothetical protein AAB451_02870 [Patescibacteria group bacterium]